MSLHLLVKWSAWEVCVDPRRVMQLGYGLWPAFSTLRCLQWITAGLLYPHFFSQSIFYRKFCLAHWKLHHFTMVIPSVMRDDDYDDDGHHSFAVVIAVIIFIFIEWIWGNPEEWRREQRILSNDFIDRGRLCGLSDLVTSTEWKEGIRNS